MEREPKQKEFGEIRHKADSIEIKKFGHSTEAYGEHKEITGRAEYERHTKPVPHLKLESLDVFRRRDQGKGFASQLMAEMEAQSARSKEPVVVVDAIHEVDNPDAIGMYGRRKGWIEVVNKNDTSATFYIFGGEADSNIQELIKYYREYCCLLCGEREL